MDLSDDAWITLASMLVLLAALVSLSFNNHRVVEEKTKVWLTPLLILICNICLFVFGVMVDYLGIQSDIYLRYYYPSGLFVLLFGIAMPFGMILWHLSWSNQCKTSISKFIFRFCYVGFYFLLMLCSLFAYYLSFLESI
jgi:hypothetical protein